MKNYVISFGTGDPRTFTGLNPTFITFANASTGATVTAPGFSEILAGSSNGGLYTFQYGTTQAIAFLIDGATSSIGSGRYVAGSIDPNDRSDEYGNTLVALGNSNIALGNTNVALGISAIAQGNSMIALGTSTYFLEQAIGSSLTAIGASTAAFGTTLVAIGTSTYSLEQAIGSSLTAIGASTAAFGNTLVAIGTTIYALEQTLALGTSVSAIAALIGTIGSTFGGATTDPQDLFGFLKRNLEINEGDQSYVKGLGTWQMLNRGSSSILRDKSVTNGASLVTRTGSA